MSTATGAPATSAEPAAGGWGLPLGVLIAGMFMSVLDTSIINVAIPELQNVFRVTADDIEWVATIALLRFRAVGQGLSMMPIMTSGMAAVTPALVGTASAFNNVAQRVSSALGLAVLTSFMTINQAQMSADRSALVTSDTPMPSLGPGPDGEAVGTMTAFEQIQTQVYVTSLDNVMLIVTWSSVVGVVLALFLRSRPSASAGAASAADAVH